MRIERWNPEVDGPLEEAAFRRKLQSQGYDVSRYIYAPGTYFSLHTHEMDRIDGVLSGHFRLTIGDDEILLGAGDAAYIPRDIEHSTEVVGDEAVVNLEAIRIRMDK
jgi:quercetin dioxygenase-like cupin family protein